MEKLSIFDQNHGLTPLQKIQIFDLLNFLFLSSSKSVFSFQNIVKHIFLAYFALNKRMENLTIFDQNHGLTSFEKLRIFDFLNFLFFYVAKCNLGKVNHELMLPAVSPGLHMTCGGAPLDFAGANHIQPCSLAIVAISAFVSESLRIYQLINWR